jgi:hypothetical protein
MESRWERREEEGNEGESDDKGKRERYSNVSKWENLMWLALVIAK